MAANFSTAYLIESITNALEEYTFGVAIAGSLLICYIVVTITLDLLPCLRNVALLMWLYRILTLAAVAHAFILFVFMPDMAPVARIVMWAFCGLLTFMALFWLGKSLFTVVMRLVLYRSLRIAFAPDCCLLVEGVLLPMQVTPRYLSVRRRGDQMQLCISNKVFNVTRSIDDLKIFAIGGISKKVQYHYVKGSSGLLDANVETAWYVGSRTTSLDGYEKAAEGGFGEV